MELATCGIAMSEFAEGDICNEWKKLVVDDIMALHGQWEDLRDISDNIEQILAASGVSFFKRKAAALGTLTTSITISDVTKKQIPTVHIKTWFPLAITKETRFVADGKLFDLPDADTCDWKVFCAYANGRLLQKRVGATGTTYDCRCVFKRHPENKTDESPVELFLWTHIDSKGKKFQVKCWQKRIATAP